MNSTIGLKQIKEIKGINTISDVERIMNHINNMGKRKKTLFFELKFIILLHGTLEFMSSW
ncbi:MAG TPA: hypothetical protein VIO64_09945 [Pseudobacteroides sp.]|uniref:hypothetical protein n=1 Tax=Pseudobacteroides sp. TaxID=1968840 RepID=UPI002F94385A